MTENNAIEPSSGQRRFILPTWLDHFNARDLKILFRCWTAIWVASLLIFIGPALHKIGIATFFAALLLYIVPPGGILFVYLLVALSVLFGMCLAWAWGLLTMKAALAARPDSQTQAQLQLLMEKAATQAQQSGGNITQIAEGLLHDGFMFDTRITIVFYVMSCVFIYVVSRLRFLNPKLGLAEIFSIITIDVFLLIGPSLPSWTGNLARILVEPGAIGVGLGFICCLILFPQSTSYAVLARIEGLVLVGKSTLQCTCTRLSSQPTELAQLKSIKAKTIESFKAIQPMLAFLPLDFCRGRWGADDVRGLLIPLRQAMVSNIALLDFHIARQTEEEKLKNFDTQSDCNFGYSTTERKPHAIGYQQLRENADMMHALKAPEMGNIRSHTLETLRESTAGVLRVSSEAIGIIAECIHTVNARRWFRLHPEEKFEQLVSRGKSTLDQLRSARSSCTTKTTERLIECHSDLFDQSGDLKSPQLLGPHDLRSLVLGMVVEERVLGSASATENLLDHVLRLFIARTEHRLWYPSGLRYAMSWLMNGRQNVPLPESSAGTSEDPNTIAEQTKEARRQLRISRGLGTSRRQNLLSRIIRCSWCWLTNSEGMYALRMVVVTIATSIPASLPSTAGFYYREKGIWGTITAQTAVVTYMADFTFTFVGRSVGTIVGGVMGMVAWYIGSGNGPGNAYGMAAITAAVELVLVWWRLFLPPAFLQAAIMAGATFVLVIGFSYDNAHTQQYGLPGIGYEAFYKRLVTVLLGLVATFVVQIFPRPPSSSRHVRKTLSNSIRVLSDHYALLLSHWGRERDTKPVDTLAEQITLDLTESLHSLQGPIKLLKLEISLGPFDQKTLQSAHELCHDLNQALGHLLVLTGSLPLEMQRRLVRTVGILDDNTIGAVMAVLGVIDQSLKTGDPLPERLPTPLLNRCYEGWHAKHRTAELSTNLVRNEYYRQYCVAVSSYLKFLSAIDDLVLVLKRALGESHIIRPWWDVDTPV